MTSAYQRGVFRSDPPPLHVGRKANPELAERRSKSEDGTRKVHKIECTATKDHLVVGKSPCIERPEEKPLRHHVDGYNSNKSRCPWDVSQLSARKTKGRRCVDTSDYYREKKFGKGPGVHPMYPGDNRASFVVPNRNGEEVQHRRRVNPYKTAESTPPAEEWKPSRRHLDENTRSQSAEYLAPKKLLRNRRNSLTSLWGPLDEPQHAPRPARSMSAEHHHQTRSPYATSFDLPERTVPQIRNIDSRKPTAPYDNTFHNFGPTRDGEVGKRNEFRPRTRVFSATNTRANIFGF